MRESNYKAKQEIGSRLRELRKARGWSEQYVADCIGRSQRAVSFWEQGVRLPHSEEMWRLCNLYGVSFEKLMGDAFGVPETHGRKSA